MKRLVIAAGCVVALGAAACSSSTGGSGEPVGISRQSTSASASTSGNSSSTTRSSAPPTTAGTPVTSTATTVSTPTTAASSPSATPTTSGPPVLPQVLSVNASSSCNGITTGVSNGTINLTWTSVGTDEVWLLPGQVAGVLVGADAKTSGGRGPYPPNGSATLTNAFSCGDVSGYLLVQPYKGGSGGAGLVQLIARA